MQRRHDNIELACKGLAEEAFKSYAGKKDYKRALEIYTLLSISNGVPKDIARFSQNMLGRLNKKIEESKK